MDEDRTQADWSMNKEVLQRVSVLTSDAYRVLPALRSDARYAPVFLDCLRGIWREILPILTIGKNKDTYLVNVEKCEHAFNELYAASTKEEKHGRKRFDATLSPVGASSEFLLKANTLFDDVLILSQRMGMHMSIKRYQDFDTTSGMSAAIK